jgi:hypothetical protein
MRYMILAAGVVAGVGLGALNASAEQSASLSGCINMADQVKSALATNSQSPSYHEAVKQQGYGRDFCANGLYQHGVDHYAQALKLLGAQKN